MKRDKPTTHRAPQGAPTRRAWLTGAAGASAAAGLGLQPTAAQAARQATQAHIVIAGSGLAGIAVAHRLQGLLDGAKITIIDAKQVHNYQPGHTPLDKVIDSNASLQPAGVQWLREMVAEFDPAANTVVTAGGQRIRYDYLVVAVGTHQDWAQI
mgnify:CR=1 FL=1